MAGPGSIVRTVAWFSLLLTSLAQSTCERIAATSDIQIETPLEPGYIFDQSQYWSSACGKLTPACHLIPTTANEVSTIIKTLNENNETFAIKSGGHNPNRGFSSVEGGPLINMKGLSEITYLPSSKTVRVGPGNRWTDVVKYLEPLGVTVVGGRIGHVGVGGYLLGQGLSYLSSQHGWAVNTVVEFEVVLANGTITTATATRNPDLFNALRGGGNNFGVVTTYVMRAYPLGKVWGGNLVFTADKTDAILLAIRNFTESYTDEKAAVIATSDITLVDLVNVWVIFLFYDGEVVPPGTFDAFFNVGIPTANTFAPTSYSFFLSSTDSLVINGQVHEFATETTPVPSARYGLEVMESYHSHFLNVAKSLALVPGMTASLAYQPLPKRLARKARQSGGDVLDLDDSVDRLSFCYILMYNLPALSIVDNSIKTLVEGVRDRREGFVRSGKLPNAYSPLFMNDGNNQQNFFSRIRPAKLRALKAARDKYDPKGLFRYRTGGFKLD